MEFPRGALPRSGPEAAVFVAGVSSLGLEILAGRIVAPSFGSSIYTWGSIIGVFLAALALGYHRSGQRAAERASTRTIVTVLLGAAVYVAGVLAFAGVVLQAADGFSIPPRLAPLFPVVLLFGPPVYLLGLISPYAAELVDVSGAGAGHASGRVYAMGTVGSIVGAFGTTFLLVPSVGLAVAELGFGLLLVAAAAGLAWDERAPPRDRRRLLIRCSLVVLLLAGGFVVHDDGVSLTGDTVARAETPYQSLVVVDRPAQAMGDDRTVRTLYLDGMPQSAVYIEDGEPDHTEYVFDYPRYFHLGVALSDDVDRVLFIGGGGFTGPMRFHEEYPDVNVDAVELDPAVVRTARADFGVSESRRLNVYTADGREFLERTNRTYDVIVLDAYRKDRVPYHLTTAEFMALAADRLDEDGVLVANVISAASGPGSQFYRAEYATMRTAFPHVYAFPTVGGPVVQNVELVATKRPDGFTRAEVRTRIARRDVGVPLEEAPDQYRGADQVPTDGVPVLRDEKAPVDRLLDPQLGRRYVISRNGSATAAPAAATAG